MTLAGMQIFDFTKYLHFLVQGVVLKVFFKDICPTKNSGLNFLNPKNIFFLMGN